MPARTGEVTREVFIDWAAAALPAQAWLQRCFLAPALPGFPVPDEGLDRLAARLLLAYCLSNRAAPTPETVLRTAASAAPPPPLTGQQPYRWPRRQQPIRRVPP